MLAERLIEAAKAAERLSSDLSKIEIVARSDRAEVRGGGPGVPLCSVEIAWVNVEESRANPLLTAVHAIAKAIGIVADVG